MWYQLWRRYRRALVALLAAPMGLGFPLQTAAAPSTSLTVTVTGLRNQTGRVCLSLFSKAQGFPSSASRAAQAKCLQASSSTVTFGNLHSGNYAVAVFHDVNGDGTLNRNSLGVPTEGFGFSRNPRILTGPPAFSDSAVFVAGPSQNLKIQLNYFL